MKQRVIHHGERRTPPIRSEGDRRLIRKVTRHVERHLGHVENVFHDLVGDTIHLDLLWVEPGPRAPFHTVVTCGMSERPIRKADPAQDTCFAELLLRLPADWPLDPGAPGAADAFWPLVELQHLARLPHVYACPLWGWHTVANGTGDGPLEPLDPTTRFCGSALTSPDWTPEPFRTLRVDIKRKVRFFSVVPLFAEELRLARDQGSAVLFDLLEVAGVTDLLNPNRPNILADPQ